MRLSLDFVALSVDSSNFDARELHDTFVYLAFQPLVFEEGALATILAPNGCWLLDHYFGPTEQRRRDTSLSGRSEVTRRN